MRTLPGQMKIQYSLNLYSSRKWRASKDAFTLLELMVGLVVFSLVLLATNMVFHNALSLREKTQERIDRRIPEEYAERFFQRDIQGMIFGPGAITSILYSETSGGSQMRSDRLEFITTSGRPSMGGNQSDLQKVEYYLDDSSLAYTEGMVSALQTADPTMTQMASTSSRTLYRLVTANPLATSDPQLDYQPMLENVESFQVQLCDGESWLDSWDSTTLSTNLPTAVRVRIIYAEPVAAGGGSMGLMQRTRKPSEWVFPVLTEFKQDLSEDEEDESGL